MILFSFYTLLQKKIEANLSFISFILTKRKYTQVRRAASLYTFQLSFLNKQQIKTMFNICCNNDKGVVK